MSNDETPPHVTALFDQQRAAQTAEDKLPEGVVAQVRIRKADMGSDYEAMAASFVVDIRSLREAAALLVTLEEVVATFGADLSRKLSKLAMTGPAGMVEMMEIVQMVMEARNTKSTEVKRFFKGEELS